MNLKHKNERKAEWFLGGTMVLYALSPILVNYGAKSIPPLHFLAIITLISVPLFLAISLYRGELKQLLNKKAFPYLLGVTLLITVFPQMMVFWGAQHTSGINTALLQQSELLFATFIYTFFGEKLTQNKLGGAFLILLGNGLILFKDNLDFNSGDAMIFLAGGIFPFGNVCAKRALKHVSWSTILLFRMTLGGALLTLFATLFSDTLMTPTSQEWLLLVFMGLIIWGVEKIFWYLAMKHLELMKMTSMLMSYPVLSLLFAYFLLKEVPDIRQLFGLLITAAGLWFVLRSRSPKKLLSPSEPG